MARRKKNEPIEYNWSKYQKNIYDFVQNGQGNATVEACPGAGKTSTLIKCLDFIGEDKKVLLSAFNKDIVKELEKRVKGKDNVSVMTMHSLGLHMLQQNFVRERLSLEPFKYHSYAMGNIKTLASFNPYTLGKNKFMKYITNVDKYIDYGRFYLCETINDLGFIEERYEIDTLADEKAVALEVLQWGKNYLETIDYTDMIWLPNVLMCQPYGLKFDWILLDEAQDINKTQRELVLKCRKINTRMISFLDENQTIYSFSGADPDSAKELKSLPNTVSLPLSISYRCADNIVSYAKKLVPTIEENDDGRKGEIIQNASIEDVQDGDMVLCRNNAPLMQVYNTFIKEGKKCSIRGKDIGRNLKNLIKQTKQTELNINLDKDGVFVRLYDDLFEARDNLMLRCNIDLQAAMNSELISNKLDMINALQVISEDMKTADELCDKIDEVFSDKKKVGISLSTIHKAKGLEADRVFIACKSLMPSKSAKKDWEIKQEYNLMYVAYTRAKNTLGFLDEKEFKDFDYSSNNSIKKLKLIEEKIDSILGKKPKYLSENSIYSSKLFKEAQKLVVPKENFKTLNNDKKEIK